MSTFDIVGDEFHLDGRPHQVISGALHYFRVPRDCWADRIRKARMMGLNAIETYVAWNQHAPAPGEWRTDDNLDLAAFLDQIHAEGLHAIVRPGPYICSEFDGGGLPQWLLRGGETPIRCSDPRFLGPTLGYLASVYDIVAPRQVDRGGPVILVQIENEYGAYGRDLEYLRALTDATRAADITVPLTTVDQPRPSDLPHGTLPDLLATGSFGSRSAERLAYLREVQPHGPLMCSEFWDGWFDSWMEYHHVTPAAASADALDEILAAGASVNIYMFHGGTNFGLTSGANDKGLFRPITTSYDYDAPLDEAGNPTEKYWAFREVIGRYAPLSKEVPPAAEPAPTPPVALGGAVPLRDLIDEAASGDGWVSTEDVPTFDGLGHYRGYLVHEADVTLERPAVLAATEVRDRAIVYAGAMRVGLLDRTHRAYALAIPAGSYTLRVVVEDMGHVDYGPRIGEAKGLIAPVTLDGETLKGWRTLAIDPAVPLCRADRLPSAASSPESHTSADAAVVAASFALDAPADLFLDVSRWGKGLVWVNDRLLGRYWAAGPQETLYVPAPFVHPGENSLMILETEPVVAASLSFSPAPRLGPIDW